MVPQAINPINDTSCYLTRSKLPFKQLTYNTHSLPISTTWSSGNSHYGDTETSWVDHWYSHVVS